MKFLHNENYYKEIEKLFINEEHLDIAVAFFGNDSIDLFDKNKNKKIRIVCNLESGACNPFLIEKINKRKNISIKTNKRLHAKTLIQNNNVIIGSANISANGLSFEGRETSGWLENGILTDEPNISVETKSWYKKVWMDSIEITDSELEKYKGIWVKSRNNRLIENNDESIIDAARKNILKFQDRKIYFAVYRDDKPSKEAIDAYENAKKLFNGIAKKIDFFENWSDLPEDAYLISIYVGHRNGVRIDGILKTNNKQFIEKVGKSDDEITLCFKEDDIFGHKLSTDDKLLIKENIHTLIAYKVTEPGEAFLVPLTDVITKFKTNI